MISSRVEELNIGYQKTRPGVTCYSSQAHRLGTRDLALLLPQELYMLKRKTELLNRAIEMNLLQKQTRKELHDIKVEVHEN